MFDLAIYYMSGNVEYFTPQALGVSFGGGCLIAQGFLSFDRMEDKGIRATIVSIRPAMDGEEPVLTDYVLVAPEDIPRIEMVFDNLRHFMIRADGRLLNPVDTQAYLLGLEK